MWPHWPQLLWCQVCWTGIFLVRPYLVLTSTYGSGTRWTIHSPSFSSSNAASRRSWVGATEGSRLNLRVGVISACAGMLAPGAFCWFTSVGDGKAFALLQHAAEDLAEQVECLRDSRVVQAVVDGLPIAPGDDQPPVAQEAEVLGEVALAHAQALDQLAHRARAVSQLLDDQEPGRVSQGFAEKRVKLVELLLRLLGAHVGSVSFALDEQADVGVLGPVDEGGRAAGSLGFLDEVAVLEPEHLDGHGAGDQPHSGVDGGLQEVVDGRDAVALEHGLHHAGAHCRHPRDGTDEVGYRHRHRRVAQRRHLHVLALLLVDDV